VKVSRVTFLRSCGMALLGAGVDLRALTGAADILSHEPAAIRHAGQLQLQDATALQFLPHLNTSFTVRTAAGTPARFVLEQVVERPVTKNVEQFSLMFRAPDGSALPDGTHALQHPALGDFNLFIVPVGASNSRRPLYQACFSRHLAAHDVRRQEAAEGTPPCVRT
jgi:hypothetical protein